MELTKEEKEIIEKNHNLIYGVASKYKLDLEEWYGLLAIELCNAVKKHNPEKSELSTYYYIRVQGLISKEYRKKKAAKREHQNIVLIENCHGDVGNSDFDKVTEIKLWIESQNNDVLNLKYQGYNQNEIAEKLGLTQSNVSRTLKKLRRDFEEYMNDGKV